MHPGVISNKDAIQACFFSASSLALTSSGRSSSSSKSPAARFLPAAGGPSSPKPRAQTGGTHGTSIITRPMTQHTQSIVVQMPVSVCAVTIAPSYMLFAGLLSLT